MKTPIRLLCALFVAGALTIAAHAADTAAPLQPDQQAFLNHYQAVCSALAADNLPAAQQAAAAIDAPNAKALAQADNLKAARKAFRALSRQAVGVAKGHEGYYVAFCPMVSNHEGYWVQTDKQIKNPYMGKMMSGCGSIVN